MGLFLYATGTPKTTIEFLGACGLSTSHNTVLDAHKFLAKKLMKKAAEIARGPHMFAFDNVQISMSKHFTQRPGATPLVSTYTTMVLYSLMNACLRACRLDCILEQRKIAPMITYEGHILPSQKEMVSISVHIAKDIIKILMDNTKGFKLADYAELLKHEAHRLPQDNDKVSRIYAQSPSIHCLGCRERRTDVLGRFEGQWRSGKGWMDGPLLGWNFCVE